MPTYHPLTQTIQNLLEDNNFWYETFEHQPVRTSEEAAQLRHGYTIEQGTKSLIVRVKPPGKKMFVMIIVPGNAKFDEIKVKQYYQSKDVRFATAEEVFQITDGVLPGGVPPFGNLFGLEVVVDPSVFDNEKIIFNAGDKSFSIAMKAEDYKTLVKPQVVTVI